VLFGTWKVTLNAPRPVVATVGMPAVAPSQVNWIAALFENPCPVAVTFVPGAPRLGERTRLGPPANVWANGNA
jgi:hypothetical protein